MTAKKAIRLGWINPPPTPTQLPRLESQQGQIVMLEPLARERLPIDQGAAADG